LGAEPGIGSGEEMNMCAEAVLSRRLLSRRPEARIVLMTDMLKVVCVLVS
jgi:hypothetical protein